MRRPPFEPAQNYAVANQFSDADAIPKRHRD
jgi:hypothetical protein